MYDPSGRSSEIRRRLPEILGRARNGQAGSSLGGLLEFYRGYLHLLAGNRLNGRLRRRIAPSDLVQETMLHAYRDVSHFRGATEQEFLAWLRKILIHRLHECVQKHVQAERRDVRREVPLEHYSANGRVDQAAAGSAFHEPVATHQRSPMSEVIHQENAAVLSRYLSDLPEQYRQIIVLRNLQGESFESIGATMQRSTSAARMLWLRAIARLREAMQEPRP